MTVEINHKEIHLADGCKTLADLLRAEGIESRGRAIAVNNRVVSRTQWEEFPIEDGMKITIIRAVCGG